LNKRSGPYCWYNEFLFHLSADNFFCFGSIISNYLTCTIVVLLKKPMVWHYKRTKKDLQNIHIKLRSNITNPTNNRGELMCSGRVSISCSTCDNLVTNPVKFSKWRIQLAGGNPVRVRTTSFVSGVLYLTI
jgi:hypothetical protein